MSDSKLKPCPFCLVGYVELCPDDNRYWVFCTGCRTSGPIGTKEQALDGWNNRPSPGALAARNIELEAALGEREVEIADFWAELDRRFCTQDKAWMENYAERIYGDKKYAMAATIHFMWKRDPRIKEFTYAIAKKLKARVEALESENASLLAVFGLVDEATDPEKGCECEDHACDALPCAWCFGLIGRVGSVLAAIRKPLAVVEVPDGAVAMVIASDPDEKMVVLTDAIGGSTVVVLSKRGGV